MASDALAEPILATSTRRRTSSERAQTKHGSVILVI